MRQFARTLRSASPRTVTDEQVRAFVLTYAAAEALRARWTVAATWEENLEKLRQQGVQEDVLAFLGAAPPQHRGVYMGFLRTNPQATVADLTAVTQQYEATVQRSQQNRETFGPTPFELQLASGSTPEFRDWMLIELKKCRRGPKGTDGNYQYFSPKSGYELDHPWLAEAAQRIRDWHNYVKAQYLNINLSSYDLESAGAEAEIWQEDMEGNSTDPRYYKPIKRDENGRPISKNVSYVFPDGWFVIEVPGSHNRSVEGCKMNNCVGGYDANEARIFSLRDQYNEPYVTIEVSPNNWRVKQIKANSNDTPTEELRARLKEWFAQVGEAYMTSYDGDDDDDGYDDDHQITSQSDYEPEWDGSNDVNDLEHLVSDAIYGPEIFHQENTQELPDDWHEDYGLEVRDRPRLEWNKADVSIPKVYEGVSKALNRGILAHPNSYALTPPGVWNREMDGVAEKLADGAFDADISRLNQFLRNREWYGKRNMPWDEFESDYGVGFLARTLRERRQEIEDYYDMDSPEEEELAQRDIRRDNMFHTDGALLNRAMFFLRERFNQGGGQYQKLLAQALGLPHPPSVDEILEPMVEQWDPNLEQQFRLFRPREDDGHPSYRHQRLYEAPGNFDQEYIYAKRSPLLKRWTIAAKKDKAEGRDKGAFEWKGLSFYIENPKGTYREKKRKDGSSWRRLMHADYGRINKTEGADGDCVDVFIGPDEDSGKVYVVDQIKEDGSFDEHKCLVCLSGGAAAAKRLYLSNYPKNWKVGGITEMTLPEFKKWLKSSKKGPAASR